jgi:hypothetical protein
MRTTAPTVACFVLAGCASSGGALSSTAPVEAEATAIAAEHAATIATPVSKVASVTPEPSARIDPPVAQCRTRAAFRRELCLLGDAQTVAEAGLGQ